jgi:replication fork protection complex subunit Tof1/Swi1
MPSNRRALFHRVGLQPFVLIFLLNDATARASDNYRAAFFASILKDIKMERAKVKETDNLRLLYLSRFFLEYFLLLYNRERERGVDPKNDEAHDFGLIAEMTEGTSIGYIQARMRICLSDKPPSWTELHAAVDCFIQVVRSINE